MSDGELSNAVTRRSVLKHTGVATFTVSVPTKSATAEPSSTDKVRLLEAAITYDVLSEPSRNNVEFSTYTTCPSAIYYLEDGVVRTPASKGSEKVRSMFKGHERLINFGGLRPHENGRRLGNVRAQSIVKSTIGSLRPYELWELAGGKTHRVPGYQVIAEPDRSIVKTQEERFEVEVGETRSKELEVEDIEISAIKFSGVKVDNPGIPDRELSENYVYVSRRVEVQPELIVRDHGTVELE